ncbi:MAG: putative peptidase [Candidatus Saccharibacteria bacterium]|nr:putative peptidase [Candidatus Saccharibacteria bacterium]
MPSFKKIKKLNKRFIRSEHFVYLIVAALLIVFVWWFVEVDYISHRTEPGSGSQLGAGRQTYYKDLNLRVARQAEFTSEPIKQVSDQGVIRGARHIIFKFGVPHDNLTESGLMTLPSTPPPAGGYPVLILLHGYANPWSYSTEKSYLPDMEFYSRNGIAVLKPDLRGQGLSIPDGQPEGAYYSMAYNTDTLSLVAAAQKTDYLNGKKISVWGHSMGAYIALRAAVVSDDIVNAILLAGPVGYIQDMFTAYVAISDTQNATAANIRLDQLDKHGTPITNPEYWNDTSPLNFLSGTKAHIQIHVGTADQIVPPRFSADLNEALNNANKPHEYYVYTGAGHGLVAQRSLIWQRSLALLK